MNRNKILLAACLGLMAIFNSCKDDTGTLGPNVLPKSDLISAYQTDTSSIVTSMFLKDSSATLYAGDILLGSYNDPVFGPSKASFYASVSPCATYTVAPWKAGLVDSAVLIIDLAPALYYGGADPQVYEVYQTDSSLTTAYNYSSMSIPHSTLMGSQLVAPPTNNTINDTLKIKLSTGWLTKHFYIPLEDGTNWTTTFQNVMKGIYVTTATPLQLPGQGSLVNILDFTEAASNICVYYHTSPGVEQTAPFYIGTPYWFVHFDHNYATTAFGSMHPTGIRDSVPAGQLMYVQAMGGVMGRINFPNLYKNWLKMGPVIINEAVVNIPYQATSTVTNTYTSGPPAYMNLIQTDSIGGQMDTPWTGAELASSTPANNSYSFLITQYIQGVIDGKIVDRGLFVLPDEVKTANGVVMYGAQHGVSKTGKTVLTIYYTPVKKN